MDEDSFIISVGAHVLRLASMVILALPLMAFTHLTEQAAPDPSVSSGKQGITVATSRLKFREFDPIILRAARQHQVDPALVKAIVMAESGFNPRAVSTQGAQGLMQLMPKTARALGVKDSFNPEHNIDAGVRHLKSLLNKFDNNLRHAVAAYNAGSSKVKKHNGVPPFRSTRIYLKKVFQYYRYYKGEIGQSTDGA